MKEEDRMKHYIEQTQKIERDINILKKWKKEAEENAKVETEPILRAYYDGKSEGFYEAIALAEDTQKENNTEVKADGFRQPTECRRTGKCDSHSYRMRWNSIIRCWNVLGRSKRLVDKHRVPQCNRMDAAPIAVQRGARRCMIYYW